MNYMKFVIEVNENKGYYYYLLRSITRLEVHEVSNRLENNGMEWPRLMGELGKRTDNWIIIT